MQSQEDEVGLARRTRSSPDLRLSSYLAKDLHYIAFGDETSHLARVGLEAQRLSEQFLELNRSKQSPDLPIKPIPAFAYFRNSGHILSRGTAQRSSVDTYDVSNPTRRSGDICQMPTGGHQERDISYMLRLCSALMSYDAPTHRLERYMHSSAQALNISLDSFYLPGCMIISCQAPSRQSSQVHVVRCTEDLDLTKLYEVHAIHKAVVHKNLSTLEAVSRLDRIASRGHKCPLWLRVILFGLTSLCFGPISYGARPLDLPIIFILGSLVGYLQLVVAPKPELYGYVMELTAAILVSCFARGFGTISWGTNSGFCFSAISQASIVLLLPGFTITCSALELQSKNIVSGAVRMIYAIIYTLFLASGFAMGTNIYGAMDANATSSFTCNDEWPFWWQVTFVIPFVFCFVLLNGGSWSKMPAMAIITCAGWVVNTISAQRFQTSIQIPQALGAATVGVLANLYARLFHGLAIGVMHPAVYIQVPGSFAASGSFTSALELADQINRQLQNANSEGITPLWRAGASMVEIAVSITVGLSLSFLLVDPFRKRAGKSGIFSL